MGFQTNEGGEMVFTGLDNYTRLLNDPIFHRAFFNTLTIFIMYVPILTILAVVLAVLLNSRLLRFKGLFRVSFFLPSVTSLVAASVIFVILLDSNYGLVNYLLTILGLEPVPWLNSGFWARISVVIVMLWRWTGYNMVIVLARLQNIPNELYEAASIDGASKLRQFFSITLPQLKSVILFVVVLSTIGAMQMFDEAFILTEGGPNNATLTITMYLYRKGFQYFDFGYASAVAYVLVVIIGILSYFQLKLGGEKG